MSKILLLDVDGVLMINPKYFSQMYCEKYNKDVGTLLSFFMSDEFANSSLGKYDLKDAIRDHCDKWQCNQDIDVDTLLDDWFQSELCVNTELVSYAKALRKKGTWVGIATQQEKYRAAFLRDTFKGVYDEFYVSCVIGHHKHTDEYWKTITDTLPSKDVLYIDDNKRLVDLAASHGLDAHIYESVEQVKRLFEQ